MMLLMLKLLRDDVTENYSSCAYSKTDILTVDFMKMELKNLSEKRNARKRY